MSVSITIRHVPDATRSTLAERAARSGRSLQEYLVSELQRLANEPTVDDWLDGARTFASKNPPASGQSILADLESGRQ